MLQMKNLKSFKRIAMIAGAVLAIGGASVTGLSAAGTWGAANDTLPGKVTAQQTVNQSDTAAGEIGRAHV